MRLYPLPGRGLGSHGIYEELVLPGPRVRDLPYVAANMVSSVDGTASVSGKASGIGSQEDRRVMRVLRSLVDAVMVGAGTLRAEKLNLGLDEPSSRQPLAVIVGGAEDLDLERLVDSSQETLVVTPAETQGTRRSHAGSGEQEDGNPRRLRIPASGRGRVDLESLLKTLRADHGVQRLLVEGGPSLNRALLDANLLDELFLTLAPKLLPGCGPQIILGDPQRPDDSAAGLRLLSVHAAEDELFLRYRVHR